MNDLSTQQLQRLLSIQRQIESLQREKQRIMGGSTAVKQKPKMSEAARRKIAAKVKERWRKVKESGKKHL